MKTWLKGGIILLGLDLILMAISYLTSSPGKGRSVALSIAQFPFTSLFGYPNTLIVIIGGLITYFILGSLIGFIISKFKKTKRMKK